MDENTKLKFIYEEAYNFLKDRVGEDILKRHLEYYHSCNPKTICDVFKQMAQSLKNKQGYVNFIADIEQMGSILEDFKPQEVMAKFDNVWARLFNEFKREFGNDYKMDIKNKKNAWVQYSKGILSCANFLSNFDSVDEFDAFVKSFFLNEFTIAALPMLLEKEIFGFGFPLACDFLKELGYYQYGKPDVHLKDIFMELKFVQSTSDYEIFKRIVKIGLIVKQDPVIVDKIFWLIGSGKFHICDMSIGSQKATFINLINKKLRREHVEKRDGLTKQVQKAEFMRTIPTWAGKSTFSYSGSVKQGTKITYGSGYSINVSASQYSSLLNHYRHRIVEIGTSRTNPPRGSVGEWLQGNVTKTAIASYVGPILITEGYAVKNSATQIRFI